mgnify:FL=1
MIKLPEECTHEDYATLFEFWRSACTSDEDCPKLRALNLMDVYLIAPRLVIIDVEGDAPDRRFRWRYAGTGIRYLTGVEMTNRYADEMFTNHAREQCNAVYGGICDTGQPHFWHYSVSLQDSRLSYREYGRLLLPVMDDDGKVSHLICVYVDSLDLTRPETEDSKKPMISIEPIT